jgi:uncharacterized membrane protein
MKRTTNLPDDPPPLVSRAPASHFGSITGGFPGVAAKLSLCAGLFSFLLSHHAATAKVQLSHQAVQGVLLVCVLLIVAGLVLSTWALISNRNPKRPGVTGFAVAGLLINGALIALHAYSFLSARMGDGR